MSTTTILQPTKTIIKEYRQAPGVIHSVSQHHPTRQHTTSPNIQMAQKDTRVDENKIRADLQDFNDTSDEEVERHEYTNGKEKGRNENGHHSESFSFEDDRYLQPATISSETRLSSWSDLDLSVVVALVSPIGHWLTGGDHIKNLILIVLLIFYLHQLIQVPWELYRASLPRRPPPNLQLRPKDTSERLLQLARSELRTHQLFYLLLTVISPLLGATFLRFVLSCISGTDQISWFSTTLFVLATGMRPWSHLLSRLRERTHDLHDSIHYPSADSAFVATRKLEIAMKRIDILEKEIQSIKEMITSNVGVVEIYEDLNGGLDEIEKTVKRNQRKADVAKVAQEKRLAALENGVAFLLEHRSRDPSHGASPSGGESGLVHTLLAVPRTMWKFVTLDYGPGKGDATVQEMHNGKRRLETIPEDPADEAIEEPFEDSSHQKPRSLSACPIKITVSPLSLIGLTVAAVTWPLRVCIAMFLAIQRYFS